MAQADPRIVQARLVAQTDVELQRVLLDAARQAESLLRRRLTTFSGRISQAQLLLVLDELRALSHELWQDKIPTQIARQIAAAERAATVSVDELDRVMVGAFRNSQIQEAMIRAQRQRAKRVAQVFKTRAQSARFELSPNVYKWEGLSNGLVERTISSAIARGAPARDIARSIGNLINPNVRGGISYAAKRTGRTEVANAYHATSIAENSESPFVSKMEWHLSRSHPKADDCDSLAGRKFIPSQTPSKPHPQCLCYITPVPISDKKLQQGMSNGDFNDYLGHKYPDLETSLPLQPIKVRGGTSRIKNQTVREERKKNAGNVNKWWEGLNDEQRARVRSTILNQAKKSVNVRLNEDALDDVLRGGRFKNAHQKISSDGDYLKTRTAYENEVMGLRGTSKADRPIYGYLGNVDEVSAYGNYAATLKDSVKARATASAGDSLNGMLDARALKDLASLTDDELKALIGQHETEGLSRGQFIQYMEAQIHGGVALQDIERVTVPFDAPEALINRLRKSGIQVDVELSDEDRILQEARRKLGLA